MGSAASARCDREEVTVLDAREHLSAILPALRDDIQLSVHTEDGEQFLVLSDPFGIADGPIMVHADMLDLLQACDGETSWRELARASGIAPDSGELMRIRGFVGHLAELGYLDGEGFLTRKTALESEWNSSQLRPTVCAGTTYPADPAEAEHFFANVLGLPSAGSRGPLPTKGLHPCAVLVPHIDYRVAPHVYAPGLLPLIDHPAELVIAIGTSHYWSDDAFILTTKDYQTPFGSVQTDVEIVNELRQTLPGAAQTDLAHRPEHSLELHISALHHLWGNKPFRIVPILVTMEACSTPELLDRAVQALTRAIAASGKPSVWCISGDLAHVGRKFGDTQPASELIDSVRASDAALLRHLENADVRAYDAEICTTNHQFRICGYAPTVVALEALTPQRGTLAAYDVWHETETSSAVSFTSVVFYD